MFRNIIVPVDGSEPSNSAITFALRMAGEEHATITFAHAVEVTRIIAMTSASAIGPQYALDAALQAGRDILAEAQAQADDAKVKATTELLEGDCVGSLLDLAERSKADLIVIGSHGRGGISRAILGSVAEGVLRRSPIPVLVTHAPKKPATVTLVGV
ncbi:MAG: universal stress protein [Candidatus Eremiobacteraeota bacterium]|nr:universal stress protein [Candidatus Eremiobacteraeota bacterium]